MTIKTVDWAAGFLDGEGSFCLSYKKGKGLAYPRISAFQNEIEPLEWLKELFGGRICLTKGKRINAGYLWSINGVGVRDIMLQLRPLMTSRRQEQIDYSLAGEVRRPDQLGSANRRKQTCPVGHEYVKYYRASEDRIKRECPTCRNDNRRLRYKNDAEYREKLKRKSQGQRDLKKAVELCAS